ncbi:cytochrome b [Acinetobacter sp. COS3]|uniref:cytochrome b n=1 Tax=Acinetobacter sp. COS3 TaxID=1397525 RepID=UPI0003B90688|nr:cytochrome b/b6 domain-containing protein [Acinetobacter sp. COS3]ERS04147.1 cytochrome b [Acinetobacter sp. COS3]
MENNYPKPIIILHWLTLCLVLIAYFSSGNPLHDKIWGQVHVMSGLLVFAISIARVTTVYCYRKQLPHNKIISRYQEKLFKLVRLVLYLSLFVVPVMGWLALSSMTTQFDLYSMQLPLARLTTSNHLVGEAHQFLGNMFIFFVGLHAAAALAHHFIFKDGVLKSMLAKNDK